MFSVKLLPFLWKEEKDFTREIFVNGSRSNNGWINLGIFQNF